MSSNSNTILISLNNGIAVRNILQTDLFRELQKSNIKIVLLTPNAEEEGFKSIYRHDNVVLEKLDIDKYQDYLKQSIFQGMLKTIKWFILDTQTISDWYEKVHKKERKSESVILKLRNAIEDILIRLLRSSSFLRKLLIKFEGLLYAPSYHQRIFNKHKPQWVLVTSLGFFDFDQYIMREARRNNAKIISMILSWDNTSTRGIGTDTPDSVIAWTEIMKRELVQLHGIKPEKVFVGGVPHFDHYYKKDLIYSKENFLQRFGLSSEKKTIFFATKSPTGYLWNPEIAEIIARAIQDDRFVSPCQLLVRLHPIHFRRINGRLRFQHLFDCYKRISQTYDYVVINSPEIKTKAIAFDMPDTELFDVSSILYHADVIVNLFSTMNLEASIFDLPIVNVSFEGQNYQDIKKPRNSIKIDEMQVHNQRVIQTGGVRLAYNEEQLIEYINMYLKNPETDKEGREKILERECGPYRGKAGKSIARHLLEVLHSN